MISLRLRDIAEAAKDRKAGYLKEVLRRGKPAPGGRIELSEEAFADIRSKYSIPPSFGNRFSSLVRALVRWVKAGLPTVDSARYLRRRVSCFRCVNWEGDGWFGTGRCRLCGCATSIKLRLATEKCPAVPPRW